MTWNFVPYSIILLLTTAISLVTAMVAWQRRSVNVARTLAYIMLAVAWWTFCASLEAAVVELPVKILLSKLLYIGAAASPALMLILAAQYSQRERWLQADRLVMLAVIPVMTLGLTFTNELHRLIWTSFTPGPAGTNSYIYEHGIAFWVYVAYIYITLLIALVILLVSFARLKGTYRKQLGIVLVGMSLPWISSVLYIFNLNPWVGFDITPIGFAFSGILLSFAILRLELFNLVPIARDAVIEAMSEGAVVVDHQNRVADINPAAEKMLHLSESPVGKSIQTVFQDIPEILALLDSDISRGDVTSPEPEGPSFDVRITPLLQNKTRNHSRIVIFHDITDRKNAEEELRRVNTRLQANLEENRILQSMLQEQAIRDSLTGLYNRRYLEETLNRELARAEREGYSVGLIMIDIDDFKTFNDRFGHKTGDNILQNLGSLLLNRTRRSDIPCRFGGDEFVIVLPRANCESSIHRADELRLSFESIKIPYGEETLQVTFSAGVVAYPKDGTTMEELMRLADSCMYQAKSQGKNCATSTPQCVVESE
ncbi:MAG: diguanylate cyclase [Anaerolineaceae bacterium]|nr:diguanylate cyclase [Anaerolineaceae bacterium]